MDNKTIGLLKAAIEKRQPLKRYTNALRLVNGLGDGLKGLVLEQYNRHFAVQIFDKRWIKEEEALVGFVKSSCNGRYLIIKDRTASVSSGPDAFKARVWIEDDVSSTVIEENGLKFAVDLNDTLNSGLFLDMRHNRKVVAGLAKGRKVLNCFAYTCSFGVYCRAAGASSVVNVDISRKSLAHGQRNYELNQLAFSHNEFIRGDAVYYLKRALIKDNRFDLVILDPPSFARYDGKTFIVKKDFPQLINSAIKALNPDGLLFVSTNFSGISLDNLGDMVGTAAGERRIKSVLRLGQDKDFIGSGLMQESYLAALLVKV
ncbi:MAG: class I SAM-dependent methyltransferase [Candidatus Omnitrophota bacterium]|nr:class I SAM-dependent methyltransferase [Candidatus Omnitrophota bacterium]